MQYNISCPITRLMAKIIDKILDYQQRYSHTQAAGAVTMSTLTLSVCLGLAPVLRCSVCQFVLHFSWLVSRCGRSGYHTADVHPKFLTLSEAVFRLSLDARHGQWPSVMQDHRLRATIKDFTTFSYLLSEMVENCIVCSELQVEACKSL